ncbi:hypothetical protein ACOME3_009858 [Neoechinorhynchus agilis]
MPAVTMVNDRWSQYVGTSRILPYLYIGSVDDYDILRKVNVERIETVLSLCPANKEPIKGVEHKCVVVRDMLIENVLRHFDSTNAFIHKARLAKQKVLVHCAAGVSRAPTFVAAYIMWSTGISSDRALDFIRVKRPFIDPNSSFRRQLMRYYDSLKLDTSEERKALLMSKLSLEDKQLIMKVSW